MVGEGESGCGIKCRICFLGMGNFSVLMFWEVGWKVIGIVIEVDLLWGSLMRFFGRGLLGVI